MKKFILTVLIILFGVGAWFYPYISDLRDQGLTFDTAYDYFFSGPDKPFDSKDLFD